MRLENHFTTTENHIQSIDNALGELQKFHERTKAPNPIQHQYIGTIIDSIIGILCSAGNSLDNKNRTATFDDFRNWQSMMGIIHRTFYSMLHVGVELGLAEICKEFKLNPVSSIGKKNLKIIANIQTQNHTELDKLKKHFREKTASFEDLLNEIFSITNLSNDRKIVWRKFMKGLTIIRNKTSHSDPSLSKADRITLSNNGFSVMISTSGDLQTNPCHYAQVTKFTLDFFDEVITNLKENNHGSA